jgi:endonuclease/exonuclease/phosphatase (EEP) superfamily protein YafD
LRVVLPVLSWGVVAALAGVSAFHLARAEPWVQVVALVAVTPWIYMLAWVSVSVGLIFRRWALVACSALLIGLQLWWVLPDFNPLPHLVVPSSGAAVVRVFDANVSQSNRNLDEIAGEIRRDRAQVVALEELTPESLRSLQATGAMALYPHRLVRPTDGSFGMALWSVFPLSGAVEWYAGDHPELRAWLGLPGGRRLRLDVVHTEAPVGPGEPGTWGRELGAIRAELATEPRPLLVVGDLNATWYDWHLQSLLALGLRDAAVIAGNGWEMTWPRDQSPVVPYLRIDHVLVSPGVSVVSYRLGYGRGSDHRPLLVEVALGPARAGRP